MSLPLNLGSRLGEYLGPDLKGRAASLFFLCRCLPLESSHRAVKTLRLPVERPTEGATRAGTSLPAGEWTVLDEGLPAPGSHPWCCGMEQGQTAPAEPHPNCRFGSKMNYYFIILRSGPVSYKAVENCNNDRLVSGFRSWMDGSHLRCSVH